MPRILDCRDPQARVDAIAAAVRGAKNGRLVIAPAETGYVVVTDAFSAAGVSALQRVKGQPSGTAMGILVGSPQGVLGIAGRLGPVGHDLIAAFWPGQLALVVRLQQSLAWTVPTDRAVVRMPLHPVLLELVVGIGPAVFSGVGDRSAESPDAAWTSADLILETGPRPGGPGSTVVDVTTDPPRLLKQGAVSGEKVREVAAGLVG